MINWGDIPVGATIPFPFAAFGSLGESLTLTGLAVTDVEIYKGTSMTQRSSDNGVALMDTDGIDIDSRTGIHGFSIDTSDNTDSGFYSAGSLFWVVVDAVTINSQTVRFVAGTFRLVAAEATAGYRVITLKSGTGTGELSLSSGAVLLQATQTGVTIPTVTTLTNAPSDSSGVTTLLSRVPSGLFTGITSLAQWLGLIAGKQTGNSTARTELRATGAGSGTFDETTDSAEALRDNTGTAGAGLTAVGDTAGTTTLLSRLTSTRAGYLDNLSAGAVALASSLTTLAGKFTGITSVAEWLGLLAGKQTGNSTARTEVRATGAGSGTFDETSDSLEAVRDHATTVKSDSAAIKTVTDALPNAGALTSLATAAELAKVPKSDGTATWNATAAAQLQSEATDALNAYDPPTNTELNTAIGLVTAKTDSLPSDPADASVVAGLIAAVDAKIDTIDGNVDAILVDTGTTLQAELDGIQADTEDIQSRLPAALVGGRIDATVDGTGMEASAVDAILDEQIGDGTVTMRQALRVLLAGMAGKLSGAATTTVTIRNAADSADVIVATVDANGNRSAVTVTP